MGFWSKTGRAVEAALTLGGSERRRQALGHYDAARLVYEKTCASVESLKGQLKKALERLGRQAEVAFKHIHTAQDLLNPLQPRAKDPKLKISVSAQDLNAHRFSSASIALRQFDDVKAVATGIAAGTILRVGSWTAVSLLGSASTGVPIGTLSGAAATNATLAWFGGGSLATGGLGMAGGGMVLGGIVLVPAIGILAWKTHAKANEINRLISELDEVHAKNSAEALRDQDRIDKIESALPAFALSVEQLRNAVNRARKKLLPFGWISRARRRIRFYFGGAHYRESEMPLIEELSAAVDVFLMQFKERKGRLS